MEDNLVVIEQFDTPENAHLAKLDLEDAGIDAVVENDLLAGIGLFFTMPTCTVKLLVRESQAGQARQVLQDIRNNPATDIFADTDEQDDPA